MTRSIAAAIVLLTCAAANAAISAEALKEAQAAEAAGAAAIEKGDFKAALAQYEIMMNKTGGDANSCTLAAAAHYRMAADPNMEPRDRMEHITTAMTLLRNATRVDAKFVPAQRMLTALTWEQCANGGKWNDYVTESSKLLAMAPDDHEIFCRRALAYTQMAKISPDKYTEPALADFRQAILLKKDVAQYWIYMAQFFHTNGKSDRAKKTFQLALAQNPDSIDLRIAYASLLGLLHETEAGRAILTDVIAHDAKNLEARRMLAALMLEDKSYDAAITELDTVLAMEPNFLGAYKMIGAAYMGKNEPDNAFAAMRKGMSAIEKLQEKFPSSQPSQQSFQLKGFKSDLAAALAAALLDQAEKESGLKAERKVLEARNMLDYVAPESPQHPVRLQLNARVALAEGKVAEAIGLLERVYEQMGLNDMFTARKLIDLYERQGQVEKADRIKVRIQQAEKE